MDHGPAGGCGHLVCLVDRPAQDPAAILHPVGVEQRAWAPPLKLSFVNMLLIRNICPKQVI